MSTTRAVRLLVALLVGACAWSAVAHAATPPARPDLRVVGLVDPPSVGQDGMEFSTVITIKNSGRGNARTRSRIGVYLARGEQMVRVARVWRSPLRSGSTGTTRLRVLIPAGLATNNTYQLMACADDTKRVRETRETNNCRKSTYLMFVQPRP